MTNILATALTPGQKIKLRVADLYDRQADEAEARNDFDTAELLRGQAAHKRFQVDNAQPTAYELAMEREHAR
jgi:hypothetical protein